MLSAFCAALEALAVFCATLCTVAAISFMAVATCCISSRCWVTPRLVWTPKAESSSAALLSCPTPLAMPPTS